MIIYILCYNTQLLNYAKNMYKYPWAQPILLEKQDASFENVFWKQLDKLYEDWKEEDYVGVLAYSAFKKINIPKLNYKIMNNVYQHDYVHFAGTNKSVLHHHTIHPHYHKIMTDCLQEFQVQGKECFCNYFMCRPLWMKKFIEWHSSIMKKLIKHPLIYTNANYHSKLTKYQLIQLWGYPFYPHLPFILERLNGCFFQTYCHSFTIDNLFK